MSRYADQSNPATIKRWIKEGRGQNTGRSYKPWLYPRDVNSCGYSIRAPGQITGRMHSLLSRHERHFLQILDWHPQVTDIREQYPLPLEQTLEISRSIGIAHSGDPRSKRPLVVTTDFLVSFVGGREAAYSVKPKKELSARTLEKFAVEEAFWRHRGTEWKIVTEDEIPSTYAKNVDWIHDGKKFQDYSVTEEIAAEIARELQPAIAANARRLSSITDQVDEAGGHEPGTALLIVRQLLATREWKVNMHERIDPTRIIRFNQLNTRFAADSFRPAPMAITA